MKKPGSLLVADVGSTITTVALIDRVNGQHRFVARGEAISTHGSPWWDATRGVQAAVCQIEALLGRAFLDDRGAHMRPPTASGDGVDGCVAVSSAAAPMRVMLVGLTRDLSLFSARRALAAVDAVVVGSLALDEGMERRDPNAWLEALRRARPEVVMIAGGTDGGATQPVLELAQLVALHNRLLAPQARPVVCYAGNARLAEQVAQVFAGLGELRTMANVRPSLGVEDIAPAVQALDTLYRDGWLARVPGMARLSEWVGGPVATATRSFGHLVHYVGERYGLNVAGFDLGSSKTVLAEHATRGTNGTGRHVGGHRSQLTMRADLGVGLSSAQALGLMARIMRWLPFDMAEDEAREVLLNKGLHPQSVPQTVDEMLLEHALAREVMREVVAACGEAAEGSRHSDMSAGYQPQGPGTRWDLIIGAGRMLTRVSHPGYAAGLLLDALEPVGISKLALDTSGIAGILGAAAASYPLAAVEVVEYDAFLTLGTLVAVGGSVTPGAQALQVTLRDGDGREVQEDVPGGALRVIALKPGRPATLELHPARGLDVGLGRPGTAVTADVEGGTLGIVIDARGRPLSLPDDGERRRCLMQEWLDALTGRRSGVPVQGTAAATTPEVAALGRVDAVAEGMPESHDQDTKTLSTPGEP